MDVDFLWSLGGCRFLYTNCMATKLKINSSSSFSVLEIIFSKPPHFYFFLGLLFILVALGISSSGHPSEPSSNMASTLPSHQTVSPDSSADKIPAAETVDFQPAERGNPHATNPKGQRQFEARNHEVPSGPNPISNR